MDDSIKRQIIKSVIAFLLPEARDGNREADQRDAIEVAIQCLENAYSLEGHRNDDDIVDLVEVFQKLEKPKIKKEVSKEDSEKAEILKTEGNEAMRAQKFSEAVDKYSKAIELNPNNAIYFCNRAAALSRLNQHEGAIKDCQTAVNLDPSYSKAYGRLGIAYCNLQNYEEARKAYARAVELDPTNASYQANLNLAEEQIQVSQQQPQQHRRAPGPLDFARLINNPNVVNIASQMMNDPAFRNVVTGIMQAEGENPNPNINVLFQAGQQIAAQVEAANPGLVDNLRRTLHPEGEGSSQEQGSTGNLNPDESKHEDLE